MKIAMNRKLLPMKLHYFLYNAGTAPVVPFMPTLARQLGFSSIIVGTIYTVLPIIGMLAKPFFGFIGDKWQQHKFLFLVAQVVSAISLFSIMFVPAVPQIPVTEFNCHSGLNDMKYCPKNAKVDKCILQNLENNNNNKSLTCYLHCKMNPEYLNIICDNWGVFDNSNCPHHNSTIDMTVFLSINHTQELNSCLYFIIHEAEINGKTSNLYCSVNDTIRTLCEIKCSDPDIQDAMTNTAVEERDVTGSYQFWMFFILMIISWSGMAVVVSVGDAICFELLEERHNLYGYQRLWGAVGWGVLSIISGILVDKMSGQGVFKDYTIVFYLALGIIALDVFVSTKLERTKAKLSSNILKDVGKLFLVPRVSVFFSWCISVGLCTALIWNFLFWYLEELGTTYQGCNSKNYMKTLQGLVMGIQCFGGELPFFFLSGWILKKIGHIHAMSLVLLGFGIRFILYYTIKNPWWVLPIELMNGITFGIFYSTMASYASIVAPPGTEATLQGLVGAVFEGVGVSIGSLIGGILFKVIGGRRTFLLFGSYSLCAFFVHVILQWFMTRSETRKDIESKYYAPNDSLHMLDEQECRYSAM